MILLEPNEDLLEEAVDAGIQTFDEPIVLLADQVYHIVICKDSNRHPPPAHLTNGYVIGIYPHENGWLTQLDISAIVGNILSNGAV
jgi:chemotaxis signal transduction protein